MLQKLLLNLLLLVIVTNSYAQTITVAAASNTRYAIEEIAKIYQVETGNNLNLVFASSGKLSSQILNGAPYDIFLSANKAFTDTLIIKGFTKGLAVELVRGSLVIVSNKDFDLDSRDYSLMQSGIKSIAIANPKIAPYGVASLKVLKMLNIDNDIKDKLIFVESISQVNQHIHIGSVDAGFTSKSVIEAKRLKENINWIEVDTNLYSPIVHYVVQLRSKDEMQEYGSQFIEFLFSKKAQKIFHDFGYYPVRRESN